jgi:RsiW-degrading membrane proteinase PrsW (M82 family)
MGDTSRAILFSWAAAKITLVLTIVMACAWFAYTWNLHGGGPDWFDTLAWAFVFGGLLLVPLLLVPALIVGIVAGSLCKIRLIRKQRIRLNNDQD